MCPLQSPLPPMLPPSPIPARAPLTGRGIVVVWVGTDWDQYGAGPDFSHTGHPPCPATKALAVMLVCSPGGRWDVLVKRKEGWHILNQIWLLVIVHQLCGRAKDFKHVEWRGEDERSCCAVLNERGRGWAVKVSIQGSSFSRFALWFCPVSLIFYYLLLLCCYWDRYGKIRNLLLLCEIQTEYLARVLW